MVRARGRAALDLFRDSVGKISVVLGYVLENVCLGDSRTVLFPDEAEDGGEN